MAPWGYGAGTSTVYWDTTDTTVGSGNIYVGSGTTAATLHGWTVYVPPVDVEPVPVQPRTPEQVRADEERAARVREETNRLLAEQAARNAQFRRDGKRAILKSLKLLKEVLGPQWQEYRVDKSVTVPSGGHRPGARYRIRPDQMIDVLDQQGRVTDRLCIHTVERVPEGDDVVAKFLMATADEERLWRTANRHPAPVGVR